MRGLARALAAGCVGLGLLLAPTVLAKPHGHHVHHPGHHGGGTNCRHRHGRHHRCAQQPSAAAQAVEVVGNHLTDGAGNTIRLLGVNRSGTEYACAHGRGTFESPDPQNPDTPAMVAAIASWKVNAVRVPLNEQCWLGVGGVSAALGGQAYRQRIETYVQRLHAFGMTVILDLHVAAPSGVPAATATVGFRPMADADNARAFWASVASTFISDHRIVFDLFNEPHGISWACLRDGCYVPGDPSNAAIPGYQAAGYQTLVNAVRSTGSRQPVMAGGVDYSGNLSQWLDWRPYDPAGQLVASWHNYEGPLMDQCLAACWEQILPITRSFPVVTGETGDADPTNQTCDHDYMDRFLPWADAHGISYLAWSWDATKSGSWMCGSGPALIYDYDGTPTAYGIGVRDHLLGLAGANGVAGVGGTKCTHKHSHAKRKKCRKRARKPRI